MYVANFTLAPSYVARSYKYVYTRAVRQWKSDILIRAIIFLLSISINDIIWIMPSKKNLVLGVSSSYLIKTKLVLNTIKHFL